MCSLHILGKYWLGQIIPFNLSQTLACTQPGKQRRSAAIPLP